MAGTFLASLLLAPRLGPGMQLAALPARPLHARGNPALAGHLAAAARSGAAPPSSPAAGRWAERQRAASAAAPGAGVHVAVVGDVALDAVDTAQLRSEAASAELHEWGAAAADAAEPPCLASKPHRPEVPAPAEEEPSSSASSEHHDANGLSFARHVPEPHGRAQQQQQSAGRQQRVRRRRPTQLGQQQQQSPQEQQAEVEVLLAGQRYDSLLDLRFKMRQLQRELLGDEEEVEVTRRSPHFKTIDALFRLHPKRSLKARDPIRRYFVVRNPYVLGGKGCEFQFEDAEGKRDDFSLLKCTRPQPRNIKLARLLQACSHAVAADTAAAEAAAVAAAPRSPTGAPLCSRCSSPFKVELAYTGWPLSKLVKEYQQSVAPRRAPSKYGRDPRTLQATLRPYPEEDAEWAAGWVQFHREHAQMALLCKTCGGEAADRRRAERYAR